MRIIVDAMGGDHAPEAVVDGAVRAARAYGVDITLVGRQADIERELARHNTQGLNIAIVQASEVVAMEEHTMAVKEKKDSSMVVGMRRLRHGQGDAFASAGNSGAVMAAALFHLGRIKGIERPALGSIYPAAPNKCILLDIGANTDCKPEYLLQFAIMGAAYAERIFGVADPRVGLVSNGEEADKGSLLVRDTYKIMQEASQGPQPLLHFVGNVEGKDLARGLADVVVTDGFTGNVMIKLTEGLVSFIIRMLKDELTGGWLNKIALLLLLPGLILMLPGLLLLLPTIRRLAKRVSWREIGGAPLLGVDGVVIIGHGRSDARAVQSMIRQAKVAAEQGLVQRIKEGLAQA
jgi:glycerol-3-phosphate acyltransferase PlsX